jgi:hypothetical protein
MNIAYTNIRRRCSMCRYDTSPTEGEIDTERRHLISSVVPFRIKI